MSKLPTAQEARGRVENVSEWSDPETIIEVLQHNPSLRGITMGYFAEAKFEKTVLRRIDGVTGIIHHDDHDRKKSKSDRIFTVRNREYSIQVKCIQTTTIEDTDRGLEAIVQNDASDKRTIVLPTGNKVTTTCLLVNEYDILAVPLYPFTGSWSDYAYRRNRDLTRSTHRGYTEEERSYLLATAERISWPLDDRWETDLVPMLDQTIGRPVGAPPPSVPEILKG